MKKLTGILIMGGKSSRMKQDKALIPYRDKLLVEWSKEILQNFCDVVLVSSNTEAHARFGNLLVKDEIGDGPLAGLYSGLSNSETDWCVVLPCDTPLINESIIRTLLDSRENYDAVVAVDSQRKVHPLIGLYHTRILSVISQEVGKGKLSMMNLLDKINVRLVEFDEDIPFKNMNTLNDLT